MGWQQCVCVCVSVWWGTGNGGESYTFSLDCLDYIIAKYSQLPFDQWNRVVTGTFNSLLLVIIDKLVMIMLQGVTHVKGISILLKVKTKFF